MYIYIYLFTYIHIHVFLFEKSHWYLVQTGDRHEKAEFLLFLWVYIYIYLFFKGAFKDPFQKKTLFDMFHPHVRNNRHGVRRVQTFTSPARRWRLMP